MTTLKEDVAAYEKLMQELKADLAKAADVLSKDYGSGVSHQSSKSIGFVWQPLAQTVRHIERTHLKPCLVCYKYNV